VINWAAPSAALSVAGILFFSLAEIVSSRLIAILAALLCAERPQWTPAVARARGLCPAFLAQASRQEAHDDADISD
jgi:hypothetical protein